MAIDAKQNTEVKNCIEITPKQNDRWRRA